MEDNGADQSSGALRRWLQCNKCLKWRKANRRAHRAEKFICSDLAGISCRTVVEEAAKKGRPTEGDCDDEPDDMNDSTSSCSRPKAVVQKRPARGWGKGKQTRVCPTCGHRRERSAVGKEKHYRSSPTCRPVEETTPQVIAGLVLDLSDRLPYMAVLRKDMRMWESFTTRTKNCTTFEQAARELLWLFKQLKPMVFDASWDEATAEGFREECQRSTDAQASLKLLHRMELEAIDWQKVYELWETERAEAAATQPSKPSGKRRSDRGGVHRKGKRRKRPSAADVSEAENMPQRQDAQEQLAAEADAGEEHEEHEEDEVRQDDADREQKKDDGEERKDDGEERKEEQASDEEDEEQAWDGEDVYTVGTLVEVTLDDDEHALAVVSQAPEPDDEDGDEQYEVTFFDDKQRITLADTLRLQLPNEFVRVLVPCETVPGLPKGWIPVPIAENGREKRFVGPQGQLCGSLEEIRQTFEADEKPAAS